MRTLLSQLNSFTLQISLVFLSSAKLVLSVAKRTAQYTLALYIDRDTKQLKKSLLFDDVKDPYQLHNLPLEENKEIVAQLCGEMGAMLKEINDPWYTEKILSDRIPY